MNFIDHFERALARPAANPTPREVEEQRRKEAERRNEAAHQRVMNELGLLKQTMGAAPRT